MKLTNKERKKFRVRNNLKNVSKEGRFRLSVSRSSKNISAQIIDDNQGKTLVESSSLSKGFKEQMKTYTEKLFNTLEGGANIFWFSKRS